MFLAGGDMKEEQDEGLPDSITVRRGACVGKAGAKGDRGRASEALRLTGQSKIEGEGIRYSDYGTR
jgi:hypothetical protein